MGNTIQDRLDGSVIAAIGKQPVDAATTEPIILSGYQTIDGIDCTRDYMRVLVKNQKDLTANGIYVTNYGDWYRSKDFNGPSGTVTGQLIIVTGGTQSGVWVLNTPNPVVIGDNPFFSPSEIVFTPGPNLTGYVTQYGFANMIITPQDSNEITGSGLQAILPTCQGILQNVLTTWKQQTVTLPDNTVVDIWGNPDGTLLLENAGSTSDLPQLTPTLMHIYRLSTVGGKIVGGQLMTNIHPTAARIGDVGLAIDNLLEDLYIYDQSTAWSANLTVGYGQLLTTAVGDVFQVYRPGITGTTAPTQDEAGPDGLIADGTATIYYYCQDYFLGGFRYAPGNGVLMYFANNGLYDLVQRVALTGSALTVPAGTTMSSLVKNYILTQFKHMICNRVNSGTYLRGMKIVAGGYIWLCTTGGIAASSSPYSGTYTPYTSSVTDGTAVFQCIQPSFASQQFFWMDVDKTFLIYRSPDSHDSYASTFSSLLARYVQISGDAEFIFGASPQPSGSGTYYTYLTLFENIISTNLTTQITNFLTNTFQSNINPGDGSVYAVQFLEDNCESYRGFKSAAYLFGIWGQATLAATAAMNAAGIASGIAGLYDTNFRVFATVAGEPVSDWFSTPHLPWYSRLNSQMFPEYYSIPTIDQDSRNGCREWVASRYPAWWLDRGKDTFPQNAFGVIAARIWQDPAKAMPFIENTDRYFSVGGELIIGEFADYLTTKDLLIPSIRLLQQTGTQLILLDNQDAITILNAQATVYSANATAAFTLSIPANSYIDEIFIQNTTANAITGGLDIGTTLAGADVVSAIAVAGSALFMVPAASILKRVFSTTDPTTLYFGAHSSWNSANIKVKVRYSTL